MLSKNKYHAINDHIIKIGLKKKYIDIFKKKDLSKIINFMKSDKKNISNKINLILMKDFGKIKSDFYTSDLILKKFLIMELNE